jgi:hypothetical protein
MRVGVVVVDTNIMENMKNMKNMEVNAANEGLPWSNILNTHL